MITVKQLIEAVIPDFPVLTKAQVLEILKGYKLVPVVLLKQAFLLKAPQPGMARINYIKPWDIHMHGDLFGNRHATFGLFQQGNELLIADITQPPQGFTQIDPLMADVVMDRLGYDLYYTTSDEEEMYHVVAPGMHFTNAVWLQSVDSLIGYLSFANDQLIFTWDVTINGDNAVFALRLPNLGLTTDEEAISNLLVRATRTGPQRRKLAQKTVVLPLMDGYVNAPNGIHSQAFTVEEAQQVVRKNVRRYQQSGLTGDNFKNLFSKIQDATNTQPEIDGLEQFYRDFHAGKIVIMRVAD